ncbi:MAG: LysR family transcriptional regulator, partial [Candidatus Acidiferrales bacterium]
MRRNIARVTRRDRQRRERIDAAAHRAIPCYALGAESWLIDAGGPQVRPGAEHATLEMLKSSFKMPKPSRAVGVRAGIEEGWRYSGAARSGACENSRRRVMDLHQLEIFLTVLELNGVTRAAEKVQLTPGAVSIQMQKLSSEVHTQLFIRDGRRLVPTPAALRLAEHARRVLKQVRHIQQDFEDDPRADQREFRFATGVTTLVYRLGRPLRRLRLQYPHCDFHVSVGPTEEIVAGLLNRQLDLGLISLPVAEEQLEITPLFEEELFLLRPSPTLVRGGAITSIEPRDLADVPFLLYP